MNTLHNTADLAFSQNTFNQKNPSTLFWETIIDRAIQGKDYYCNLIRELKSKNYSKFASLVEDPKIEQSLLPYTDNVPCHIIRLSNGETFIYAEQEEAQLAQQAFRQRLSLNPSTGK